MSHFDSARSKRCCAPAGHSKFNAFLQWFANGTDAQRWATHSQCAVPTHFGAVMGKYFVAWILGVPAVLLVAIYAFTHLF
jgi:hypothetical protein